MRVPYWIVVEEQEAELYRAVVNPAFCTVLVLDKRYQRDYDTFDKLGDSKSKGPGPARNFAWEHSIGAGASWHWVMDDNIKDFLRLHDNAKIRVEDGTIFRCMEDFCKRFRNVGMAGPNYRGFIAERWLYPPYVKNTRIYSCNLIRNDLPYRWRGRYNEDTDLSLRMLKDRWCTVRFNAFLQDKLVTQSVKGGNTDEFYRREGTLFKSKMQVAMHPDVSRLTWRYGRCHHYVDYSRFKANRLVLRSDVKVDESVNDYGMKLRITRSDYKKGNNGKRPQAAAVASQAG